MKKQVNWFAFLLCCSVSFSRAAAGSDYDYLVTGSTADVRPENTQGALMLAGGGGMVDDAFRWFHRMAGGGDIVVLKATDRDDTLNDAYGDYLYKTIGGCDSVEVIVCRDRKASNDAKILQAIRNAEGIFLGGGKQFLYVDYWKGTPIGEALDEHVRAGRTLGGSSAGLAVLGEFCYSAHVTARLTSEIAMKNPFDKSITLEKDFLHFDLMRGVITDTHFTPRNRLGSLVTFLARIGDVDKVDSMLGIGVDEKTALCIEPSGKGKVFSSSRGLAWFVTPQQGIEVLSEGRPLTYRGIKVLGAGPDSSIDLRQRTIDKPASESTVSVVMGVLSDTP